MKAQNPATPRTRRASKKPSVDGAPALSAEMTAAVEAPSAPAREEMIRLAAYSIYESRGSVGGRALDDWLEAEAMIDRACAERPRGGAASH